jgi:hypothetical protein
MAKIGGFDPGAGIAPLRDGFQEIGRANLPEALRLLPESTLNAESGLVYDKLTDSSLLARFSGYLAPELRHRELLAPDVFFEVLESAAESLIDDARAKKEGPDSPCAVAGLLVGGVLADRELCETLRNLIVKA